MKLAYGEILDKSWKALRDELPLVAGLSAVYIFGIWVLSMVPVLGYVIGGPLGLGYLRCLNQIRNKQVIGYQDFFWAFLNFNRFLHSVLMIVLIYIGTAVGFILLVVPGIWFVIASWFCSPAFLLKKDDAVEAVKTSLAVVKNRWFNVFGFVLVIAIINILGALCFFVGLLISAPISVLASLIAFEQLSATVQLPPAEPEPQSAKDPAEVTILP